MFPASFKDSFICTVCSSSAGNSLIKKVSFRALRARKYLLTSPCVWIPANEQAIERKSSNFRILLSPSRLLNSRIKKTTNPPWQICSRRLKIVFIFWLSLDPLPMIEIKKTKNKQIFTTLPLPFVSDSLRVLPDGTVPSEALVYGQVECRLSMAGRDGG